MAPDTILQVTNLVKDFNGIRAVNDVSFTLPTNTITAVIGPNGAGKTTLYNLISGQLSPTFGSIKLKGKEIAGLPPDKIVKAGIGRSFQITSVFPSLTVLQNIRAAVISRMGRQFDLWQGVEWDSLEDNSPANPLQQAIHKTLALVGIEHLATNIVSTLSHGDQALVEMAIVLALEPHLILLDEPTAGMSREETRHMVELIRHVQQQTGCTFLITEHDMEVVFQLAEKIVVMHQGAILATGNHEEIRNNISVRRAYLGTDD
ncbi:MAG: ABC transporter ATP-binding protein [Nostocaceae cyanobacterium]|nr:ABC transporter ATP-binding protein [Nostocaceae cyanobacterium]